MFPQHFLLSLNFKAQTHPAMNRCLILLILLFIISTPVFPQAEKHQLKTNTEITKFLDPGYPRFIKNDPDDPDHKKWRKTMDRYADDHPPFPVFLNTGDLGTDENNYAFAIEMWFMRNRFYPQYIDTGKPEEDLANWNKAKLEWCRRYPEECKIVEAAQK